MIRPFSGKAPIVPESVFIEETAVVIGDVVLGEGSSVWFHAVVRGDVASIRIGSGTNIQDLSVLHVRQGKPLQIGDDVTVGHRAVLHACRVSDRVLVGIGAIVLDDAQIGEEAIVGAGAVVTPGTVIPPRSLAHGIPARVQRRVTAAEIEMIKASAQRYRGYAAQYR
jgi:carbonic anhydrase/acetyltransferase-like protein (isoleucine patch superfamily)